MVSVKMSFMTGAAFNRNPSKAKKEASARPLLITARGEVAYVLVSYAEFQANWTAPKTLFEALRDPSGDEREFEAARLGFNNRIVEF